MTVDLSGSEFKTAIASSCAVLEKITVPLYENESGAPALVGTGFFLQHNGDYFLLSAAHVLEQLQEKNLYYYVDLGTVRKVTGKLTTNFHTGDRTEDKIDIGAVRLQGPGLPPYPAVDKYALNSSSIRFGQVASTTARYAFIGYPASRSRIRHDPPQVIVEPYAYLAHSAPHVEYAKQGLATWTHLYLRFDKKRSHDLNGAGRSFPKPHGISGSPVFTLYDSADGSIENSKEDFGITGIVTTWHPRQARLVVTSGNLILGLLNAAA